MPSDEMMGMAYYVVRPNQKLLERLHASGGEVIVEFSPSRLWMRRERGMISTYAHRDSKLKSLFVSTFRDTYSAINDDVVCEFARAICAANTGAPDEQFDSWWTLERIDGMNVFEFEKE